MSAGDFGSSATGARTILFGGSGFLGSSILQNYPDMISIGRSAPATPNRHVAIQSLDNLDVLGEIDFDTVIYIIGNTDHQNLEKQTLERGEPTAFDYHVTPLIQTLEQLKRFPIRKLIHFSSILLYDRKRITGPVSEKDAIDPYTSRYIMSKHIAEELCRFYSTSIPIVNVRLSNIYGPTRLKRHDLIHLLVRQLIDAGKATVWTTRPRRDFIHVDDAAHAIVKLLDADFTGTVNLGTGTDTSVAEIVEVLRELTGYSIHDEGRTVSGPMEFRCDITKLKSIIDWKPSYSIEDGVGSTYNLMSEWAKT